MQVLTLKSLYTQGFLHIPYIEEEHKSFDVGDKIIYLDEAEEETHEEIAIIEGVNKTVDNKDEINYTVKTLRETTDHDVQMFDNYQIQAKESLVIFRELINKYKLQMQPLMCIYSLKGNRAHFLFTAAERVDFRDLVKDLAKNINKKIYLRQIGPRDRARIVDGYGKCGRRCCCNQFLGKLDGVSMDSARVQGVTGKGASKLLGCCGKLLCCINYEAESYMEMSKDFPNDGQRVRVKATKEEGICIGQNYFKNEVKIKFKDKGGITILPLSEIDFDQRSKTDFTKKSSEESIKK